ncbi:glycosyl hydrolase family 88 [Melioribacter roseus P3M-2]|uniref:Glycosyl hydrolase family 88 n=1 Tax=Melioribacter roseus (strain DSM 23840 / JCM 17771 / VKM B-2668 / P3M-2) TaxID=1191523 RepID=I7A2Y5_MELRP|nr:glycoside hydrolase family 88 protein [Melioribacter roseus]AFN74296.1 glycosyl hydrolase family 88 [Melioribacter roseus P3M-2]
MKSFLKPIAYFVVPILFIASVIYVFDKETVEKNLMRASEQYSYMLQLIGDTDKLPRSVDDSGNVLLVEAHDWTSGFFPGSLWYLYEYTKDDKWLKAAEKFTHNLEGQQFNNTTHDLGFMIYCSFGNGYRLTGDEHYKQVLIDAAKTLASRFNPKVGCIKSWDGQDEVWEYPVIIDNMMNLELLFWATKETGDSSFYNIAVTHANTTMKNHFRKDYSTWHVLSYDTTSGEVTKRNTHQGYADESCWARGQSWGLYGFTMCYRETGNTEYLLQAEKIAEYILNHLPEDMIPFWDYDAADFPKDASAAAIMASAFYELNELTQKEKYKTYADKIMHALSQPEYLASVGTNAGFVLKHSTGNKPANSEIDVPIIYADYYFIEANLRKLKFESNHN